MLLAEKMQQCQALQQRIDELTALDLYPVEDVAVLSQQLSALLSEPIQQGDDAAEYAAFLQLNLDWLQALMAKISTQKQAIAANMLELQTGRKATRSYGQNN